MAKAKKYLRQTATALLYAAAVLGAFRLWVGIKRARAEEFYHISANIRKTDELKVGAAVRLSGIDVGRISRMELLDDYSVDVHMDVRRGVEIPDDSIAAIYTDGIMGAKYVAIVAGGSDEHMGDGDAFEYTQDSVNLYEMLEAGIENFSKQRKK
ncbi:MAG: MlaD family protein [Rickettsiales bacterium]|jgi:phospholipid/cholesterol/gamma-HCH transport system substrate-binding protein|nr:MlaD family protein [Rickettsiales bacterium]